MQRDVRNSENSLLKKSSKSSGNCLEQWSKMILDYWMVVERYPNLKEEVDGSIPRSEISSLFDKKNSLGGQLRPVL